MKLATVILNLSKEGHHVTREHVTPAELALLVAEHHVNAGGKPIDMDSDEKFAKRAITETGDTAVEVGKDEKGNATKKTVPARSTGDEKKRLMGRYAGNKVNAMFPGAMPQMPSTYEEAYKLGLGTVLPSSKLTEVKIA